MGYARLSSKPDPNHKIKKNEKGLWDIECPKSSNIKDLAHIPYRCPKCGINI